MAVKAEGSLHFANTMSNTGLAAGAKDAVGIVSRMASAISKINPFAAMAVVALAAFAKISKGAYDVAKDFEKAMKEVQTISGATQENFDKMASAIFAMSKISVDSPKELAQAFYQIASAGYDGAEGLKLLEQSAKAGLAGVADTATAADVLTTILNSYKLSAEEAERVSDILFTTVKLGKTTLSELAASFNNVAPIAAATGIDFEQISAAIASLTKQGVPTAQAMTQVRASIVSLNENLADGWSEVYTLQEAMQVLYDTAGGSQNALKDLVGRVESMNGILGLTGPNAAAAAADLDAFRDVVGATADATDIMLSANANQWELFGNRIATYTEGIGKGWLDVSTSIATSLNYLARDTDGVTKSVISQTAQFKLLESELTGVNTSSERRLEILKELKTLYPEYLSSLDLDQIANEDLDEVLKSIKGTLEDINKLQERRIELAGLEDKVNTLSGRERDYKKLYESELSEFYIAVQRAQEFALANGIELKFDLSDDPQKIYQEIYDKFDIDGKSLSDILFGDENDIVKELFEAKEGAGVYRKELGQVSKELQKQNEFLDAQKIALLDNAENAKSIVGEINKVNNVEGLEAFSGFKNEDITKALAGRKQLLIATKEIREVSLEGYKEDRKLFAKFINSEDAEIAKLATERKAKFDKFLKGGKTQKTDIEQFVTDLDAVKKNYDAVVDLRKKGYYDEAQNHLNHLGYLEQTFEEYINAQLETVKEHNRRMELLFRLPTPKEGAVDFNRILNLDNFTTEFEKEFESSISGLDGVFKRTFEGLSFDSFLKEGLQLPEVTETDALGVDLRKFTSLFEGSFGEISGFAADFGGSLENTTRTAVEQLKVYEKEGKNVFRDMSTAQLEFQKQLRKDAIAEIKDKKDPVSAADIKRYKSEIKDINQEIMKSAGFIINQAVEGLTGAAELFRKFGNEEIAGILDQLAGVGEGIQEIMKGNFVGGAFQILNSALTVEVEADTEKFEKAIDKLQINIERLSRDISDSIGTQRITNRIKLVEEQVKVQENLAAAVKAEEEARKKIQVLGVTLGRKGRGSGTDQEKLQQLQDDADALEHTLLEIEQQIKELLTGTTSQSITDSIIQGFEQGYSTIEDFGQTFEDIMKKALINALKVQFLEEAIAPFFERFSQFADDNGDGVFDLTAGEIRTLKSEFTTVIQNANDQLAAMNEIANEAGLAGGIFGAAAETDPGSLSGAITTITEDTANVLAGTLNALRIDYRNALEVAEQSLEQLKAIEQNTRYNERLESIDNHLGEIETALS